VKEKSVSEWKEAFFASYCSRLLENRATLHRVTTLCINVFKALMIHASTIKQQREGLLRLF
jgi:hypothetical protein